MVKVKGLELEENAQITVKQLAPGKKKRVLSVGDSYSYLVPVLPGSSAEETTEE